MKRQNGKNEANMEKTTEVKLLFSLGWGRGGLVMVLKKIGFGFCVCVCVFVFCCFLRLFTFGEVFRFAGAPGGREEDGD